MNELLNCTLAEFTRHLLLQQIQSQSKTQISHAQSFSNEFRVITKPSGSIIEGHAGHQLRATQLYKAGSGKTRRKSVPTLDAASGFLADPHIDDDEDDDDADYLSSESQK